MARRGQAALEFLSTYGWALVVVLVAVGALAYFGVFNPNKWAPNSFSMSDGFAISQFKVDEGSFQFALHNSMGTAVSILGYTVTGDCETSRTYGEGAVPYLDNNDDAWIIIPACKGAPGSRFKAELKLTYQKSDETVTHDTTGSVSTLVEAGESPPGDGSCLPDCEGKSCGDDGCGGDCGSCGFTRKCCPNGACIPFDQNCKLAEIPGGALPPS